jgi:hypothetical protein
MAVYAPLVDINPDLLASIGDLEIVLLHSSISFSSSIFL